MLINVFFENISCIPSWRNKTQDLISFLATNKQNPLCYHGTRCKIIRQKLKIETWCTFQSQDLLID